MKNLATRKLGRGFIAAVMMTCLAFAGPALARKPAKKKKKSKPAATKKAEAKPAKPVEVKPAETKPAAVPVTAESIKAPGDADILEAETVAVQPVLGVGAGANVAWYDIANYAKLAKVDKASAKEVASLAIAVPKAVDKGFGFAGASGAKDIRVLQFSIALGALPALLRAGAGKSAKKYAGMLKANKGALAVLSPASRSAAELMITSAASGRNLAKLNKFFLAEALKAGVRGVSAGPQRAHGYYIAGVWAGGALLYGMLGGNNTYADMAEPIAIMLDKDASFGGSDRALATRLRTIAKQLRAKKPDVRAIKSELAAMMKVSADQK
ncbi:MAG: hypothetical protein KC502_07825 [Myxococcales bacterium]|nr:hypothetical protein [Myxococcales bacterium]